MHVTSRGFPLFLTFDLTLFGAFTRLSDSGLGCPDWPGCYGNASPLGARHEIAMAQAAQPTGPVTHGKAWVEMVHRYLATSVGFLILVLAVATWVVRRRERLAPVQGHCVHASFRGDWRSQPIRYRSAVSLASSIAMSASNSSPAGALRRP